MGDDSTLLMQDVHHAAQAGERNPKYSAGTQSGCSRIGHGDEKRVS